MRSIKLFKVMLSLLIVCSMLVGTFASCDIFSGNMNFNDHVEDKDDDDDDDDDNDDGGRLDNDETQKGNKPNREEKTEREDKTDREERPNDKYETDKRDDPWVEDTYIDWETDVEVSPKDECIGGGYHEYNSEKIEDECYTGFEDGKFVEHWAYLEYCHICGESICKRYEKYVYSDNSRTLKERYEETYFYPQDGEMKISSTHIIEYAQAVSQYAGGKTYIYPVCESSIVYDGFANEKHYGKVEYRYTGHGCECVLVRTDESGRISESSPEIWHANWGEAYILEDPNGKCTDG